MARSPVLTEADILAEIVAADQPGLSRESARSLLELRFSERATARIRELLDGNNRGALTPDEQGELEKYLRVGHFLDLLHAKVRISLAAADTQP